MLGLLEGLLLCKMYYCGQWVSWDEYEHLVLRVRLADVWLSIYVLAYLSLYYCINTYVGVWLSL